ncbi:hypothetical protein ACE6ED_13245 [Paenibacillus sp. CN-4]|uniref:hypothetical protein n=1 Tax=Paenibacillus nanchangensis TaxID=3348343 RepID=UPI00397C04AF
MTPERKETTKLKKGDRVVMHTCIEAETHNGRIWTCSSDQFTRGTGALAQDSVFLEGFSGLFASEYLQKVILPTEDERLLAALEDAEQQKTELWECEDCGFSFNAIHTDMIDGKDTGEHSCPLCAEERLEKALTEAQQTIARLTKALEEVKSLIPLMQEDLESPSLRHNTGNMIIIKINAALGEGAKEGEKTE